MASHGHGPSKYKPGEVAWGAEHHILPVRTYIIVFLILTVLMIATIAASFVHLPGPGGTLMNNIIALGIAVTKATLVIMFFMHVKYSSKMVKLYAIGGFVWFLTMFSILIDYWTRPIDPSIAETWMHDPGSALPERPGSPTSYDADKNAINIRPRN